MVDNFKKFMWRGDQEAKKWVLIAWNTITKLKATRSVGIQDPYTLNQVMHVKLWWRCI